MLNIAIVEDDAADAELLKSHIKKYEAETGTAMKVQVFRDGELFLLNYKTHFDIVFMDIKLVGIDGMEAARRLRTIDQKIVIVFITSMAQYAIKGYEVDACDFAVKPLSYADFYIKMRRAVERVKKDDTDMITVKAPGNIVKISASSVYYVEVIKHDLIWHTVGGEIRSHGTMREVEETLRPFSFYRVHHSYLVNLAYVFAVRGDTITVNDVTINISRAKKGDFMAKFAQFAKKR